MAYADIGKDVNTLLLGSRACGAFQFDPKISGSSVTTSGVVLSTSAVLKNGKIDPIVKAAYSTKQYSVDVTATTSNKFVVNGSLSQLAPGLKVSATAAIPDPNSGKLSIEHSIPHIHYKATVGLTKAPTMNIAAAAKFKNYILGGDVEYASSKASPVTKYSLGMGYNAPDFQAAAFYLEKADEKKSKAVQLSYVHHLSATQSVGGEVTKSLSSEETPTFTLGYSRRLENNALAKVKLTSGGIMSLLYETKMMGGEKLSGSFMCDVTDLSKPVKYGFSLDLF